MAEDVPHDFHGSALYAPRCIKLLLVDTDSFTIPLAKQTGSGVEYVTERLEYLSADMYPQMHSYYTNETLKRMGSRIWLQHNDHGVIAVTGPTSLSEHHEDICTNAMLPLSALNMGYESAQKLCVGAREPMGWKLMEKPPWAAVLAESSGEEPGMFKPCSKCGLLSMPLSFDAHGNVRSFDPARAAAAAALDAAVASAAQAAKMAAKEEATAAKAASAAAKASSAFFACAERARVAREHAQQLANVAATTATKAGSSSDVALTALPPILLAPTASLDPAFFEPMANWNRTTWRLALSRPQALKVEILPDLRAQLEGAWGAADGAHPLCHHRHVVPTRA